MIMSKVPYFSLETITDKSALMKRLAISMSRSLLHSCVSSLSRSFTLYFLQNGELMATTVKPVMLLFVVCACLGLIACYAAGPQHGHATCAQHKSGTPGHAQCDPFCALV